MAIRDSGLPPREPQRPYLVAKPNGKRHRVWLWVGIVILVLIVAAGVVFYTALHGGLLHRWTVQQVAQKASESLNTPVHINNFQVNVGKGTIDLYGVTAEGANPNVATGVATLPPLLEVQHIQVAAPLGAVLTGKMTVNNIVIDHPVVHLIVTKDGQTNLPNMASNSSSSGTNPFQAGIRHLVLNNGEIYVNDRKDTLDADVHDLAVQANHNVGDGGQYTGTLSYANGHINYDHYAPIPHALQAKFEAAPSGMTLSDVKLTSGSSQVMLNASLENYSSPAIHAKYVVMLDLGEMRTITRNASLPTGTMVVNGAADYNSVPGKAALDTASLQGTISSHVLGLHTAALSTDIRDLSAQYALANGNAELRGISARLLGGELRANLTVKNITGRQQGRLVADLRDVSARDLKRVAKSASLKPVAISGHVNAHTEASWTGSIDNLVARADATANAQVKPANSKGNTVPVDAAIHARYDARSQELGLQQSYVRMPQTTLNLNGTVSRHSALNVSLHSADLQQLETVAEVFAQPSSPLPPIAGSATFDGTVSGSTAAPQIAGQLNANNLQARQTSIRSLSTRLQANPSHVSLQNGRLQLAQQAGRITFNIQSALDHWSHTPASEFDVNLSASRLDLAELAQLANVQTPMSGTLNANIAAHGTQEAPLGRGDITLLNANLAGAAVPNAQVRFEGTGTAVHSTLQAQISGGKAQAQLTYYPKQQGYDGTLQATGIDLSKVQVLRERNIPATGMLTLTASGRGTLKDPQGTASLTIPKLQMNGQSIDNINFRGDVTNHVATFTLGSAIGQTPLNGKGRIALVGDYDADVTFNTPVIPLQPLAAAYAPSLANELSGETEIHATLQGPLKNKTQLQARLSIPRLAVNYVVSKTPGAPATVLHVAAVAPIVADYRNGVVMLQPGEIKGNDTDVRFQGNLPLSNTAAPSTLKVQGGINLAILQAFDPTVASSGQMVFDINAGGHSVSENVEGVIRVVNANIATPDAPMGLSNGNGVLILRRDRVDISTFTADVGGGKVTASGGMTYSPAIYFDIGLKGNDLRVLYPESVRTDFGLDLAMTGTTDAALLQGNVNINSISFTPSFDLTTFINQFGGVASPPPTGQTFADKMKLAINVRSTSQLNVVSPTVSIQGDANLRAIGTAANPVIVGRTDITGGDMIFAGNRYLLQNGTIAFVNSTRIVPVVNLQVTTTVKQYNIAMRFRGPVDRMNTTYNSDPALSQADIIHLVAFGTTEEAANASPSQSSTLGAESLVASQVSSQLTSRLQKALGVSQISLDPQLGATSGNQQQGARLTVRQRVTSKLYVTFSTDVTTTQFSAIQLQYKMNPRWSVSGVRDENGGFSLDGRYHKEF